MKFYLQELKKSFFNRKLGTFTFFLQERQKVHDNVVSGSISPEFNRIKIMMAGAVSMKFSR